MSHDADPTPLTLEVQGLPLRVWDHGGDGRPVLILHGYLDTGRSWDAVAAALQPAHRALCLDWRGHGQSVPIPAGAAFHQLDQLKDLCLLLDLLASRALAPAAIIAHSMGGIVASVLAGSLPQTVSRLLLVDSLGALPEDPADVPVRLGKVLERVRRGPTPFRTFATVEDAAARVQANNPGLSEAGALRMVRHAVEPTDDGRWAFRFDPRARGPSPIRYPESFWLALFARIEARVHVLSGEHGYARHLADIEARFAALRHGSRETVPGVGHHVHLDAPEAVAAALPRVFE